MALINRVSRLFKADFHAVLDKIEEPEQLLRQAIREMQDDLAATGQRIKLCAHDNEALSVRKAELEGALAQSDEQLDLCFESGKDDLAKNLVRKKLGIAQLLQRLNAKQTANEKYLADQGAMLNENRATLEGLRQKAELITQRTPAHAARDITVGDDEVEVAFLREKSLRGAS